MKHVFGKNSIMCVMVTIFVIMASLFTQLAQAADDVKSEKKLADIYLGFQLKKESNSNAYILTPVRIKYDPWNTTPELILPANLIYYTLFNAYSVDKTPIGDSYQDMLNEFRKQSPQLTLTGKLYILSYVGMQLLYNFRETADPFINYTGDQLLEAIRTSNHKGGVCREIHDLFLRDLANSMGLEYATFDGIYKYFSNPKKGEHHVAGLIRDPYTGEWIFNNYSTLIRTGEKNIQAAAELGSRILSPFAQTTFVETADRRHPFGGIARLQETDAGKYIRAILETKLTPGLNQPLVQYHIDERGQTVLVHLENKSEKDSLSYFHSEFQDIKMDMAVLSTNHGAESDLENNWIKKIGTRLQTHLGALQVKAPFMREDLDVPAQTTQIVANTYPILGFEFRGYAKVIGDINTGFTLKGYSFDMRKLSFKTAGGVDGSIPFHTIEFDLSKKLESLPVELAYQKSWSLTSGSNMDTDLKGSLKHNFDRFSFIVQKKIDGTEGYWLLRNQADLFLLDTNSAQLLKNQLKLGRQTFINEVGFVFDYYSRPKNISGDRYYDVPASMSATLRTETNLTKLFRNTFDQAKTSLSLGVDAYYEKNRPFYLPISGFELNETLLDPNSKRGEFKNYGMRVFLRAMIKQKR